MANNSMLVPERERQVGSFLVGRLLPFRKKRLVGPFCFIDHMGPSTIGPGAYFDVDQHPHIGLSTLTYLIEGEIHHKDSTGADHIITPGQVAFMTSGRGCTHTERTPASFRESKQEGIVHGYQIWVALPKHAEGMMPRFDAVAPEDLPRWEKEGLNFTLVAGSGYGRKSKLPVYSPLFMVDVVASQTAMLDVAGQLEGEIAVVVVEGQALVGSQRVAAGEMLISTAANECCVELEMGSRVLLFGGQPFEEERYLFWNFVASSQESITQAKDDWRNWRPAPDAAFGPGIPNDESYIPLPGEQRATNAKP